ncbi:MAG TPA: signal transduction histidine kinase (STHK), LytS [Stenomitos sp.]
MHHTHSYAQRGVGIFDVESDAERALTELRNTGFPMDRVSLIAQNTNDRHTHDRHLHSETSNAPHRRDLAETTHADEGAKVGSATGGVVGGLTGLLVGVGTLAIPGVGPIMLAGAAATALATTLAGGAIGAAAGGLLGGLVGLGIPEERARAYSEHVATGKYLIVVDGTEHDILAAEPILRRYGIREWEVYQSPAVRETPLT